MKESSDLFESLGEALKPIQDFKGFKSAQSSYDNQSPEDYGYREKEEPSEDEEQAFKFYKSSMSLAIASLNNSIEFLKKIKRTEISDILEDDIDELINLINDKEKKFI